MNKKTIIRRIKNTQQHTAECKYFTYYGKGYKVFHEKDRRDFAFFRQLRAYKHGLAPKPYRRFKLAGQYVYTTEHCGPTVNQLGYKYDKIEETVRALADIGMNMYDDHTNNFCIKKDKVVCIDFGPCGFN